MAGVYFTASLLTMFISNTATAVLLAPIALQSAASMGISPYPLLLAVSVVIMGLVVIPLFFPFGKA